MAGVILLLIVMTVLEVRAALAPTLHWLACLSRRLAAVFRERQVRVMARSVEDSARPVLTSLMSSTLLLTDSLAMVDLARVDLAMVDLARLIWPLHAEASCE